MARLRPVTESPLRALGLIRVSKERDGMVSPELQRSAIVDYAQRRGYVVIEWREGIDESGSRARSAWWPRLNEAVEKVEAGAVDVIVVWKYSRTARHRLRWAVALDRVESAGGFIESATEQIDTTTSTGRFTRGMLAELSAFEAERIGDTWKEAQARRLKMGLPVSGKARFGYVYEDGMHRPDPKTAPVVASLYRRYLAGESIYALVAWLNEEGYRTPAGYSKVGPGPWSHVVLRRNLDSGFAAGFLTSKGERIRGAHEPIIDATTWQAYLAARGVRATLRRSERSQYVLSGLVRCAYPLEDGEICGAPMSGGSFSGGTKPMFRCTKMQAQQRHPSGYVMMSTVEDGVRDWLQREAADVDRRGERARTRKQVIDLRQRDADAIAREVVALDREMANLTRQLAREVILEAAYIATRDQIMEQRELLELRHAQALQAARASVDAGPVAANLLAHWDALLIPERREILRQLIARVEVAPAKPRATVRVVASWDPGEFRE